MKNILLHKLLNLQLQTSLQYEAQKYIAETGLCSRRKAEEYINELLKKDIISLVESNIYENVK